MLALTISSLLEKWAAKTPDAPALHAPQRAPLSYAALYQLSIRVSERLRQSGLGNQSRIGLVLPNGPEAAAAFLTVAASAVCAPLNPAYRRRELANFLADLDAQAVVITDGASEAAGAVAEELGLSVLRLQTLPGSPAGEFDLVPADTGRAAARGRARPNDLALLLHTSGTTSKPKIVPLSHRNLCVSAENISQTLALEHGDCCLNIMPLFHIHGLVGALLSSVASGAAVVCTPNFHARRFFAWLTEFEPTWYTAVPTMHQAILACAREYDEVCGQGSLRFVRSSSAPLPPTVLEELSSRFRVPVVESYGMTEAAHQMASNPLHTERQKAGSVGIAAGPEVAVMDADGSLVPAGTIGEVVVRGTTVMAGYERNPRANAAAFTHGWFRTGDQGYLDRDGYLFLTGRLKELINRGGEKISPREIDEAILLHPEVSQAVAFAVPHTRLGETVGVAIVRKPGSGLTSRDVYTHSAEHLAHFKVPTHVEFVDEIPRGPTGKVQRTGLAETLGVKEAPNEAPSAAPFIPPRTPLERSLAQAWREALEVQEIGLADDFFLRGGDSLSAEELLLKMTDILGEDISPFDFLEEPTIAGVIRACSAKAGHPPPVPADARRLVPIRTGDSGKVVFCIGGHNNNLWGFRNLARSLDVTMLGLRTPLRDLKGASLTIETIASRHIEAIGQSGIRGPYALFGFCSGGAVALEMARQWQARGEEIAYLCMLECFNVDWKRGRSPLEVRAEQLRYARQRVHLHVRTFAGLRKTDRLRYVVERFRALVQARQQRSGQARITLPFPDDNPSSLNQRAVEYGNAIAHRAYRPPAYAHPVTLVRCTVPSSGVYPLPKMGWEGRLIGDVEMIDLPCSRVEMWTEPHVTSLATALRNRISAVG